MAICGGETAGSDVAVGPALRQEDSASSAAAQDRVSKRNAGSIGGLGGVRAARNRDDGQGTRTHRHPRYNASGVEDSPVAARRAFTAPRLSPEWGMRSRPFPGPHAERKRPP